MVKRVGGQNEHHLISRSGFDLETAPDFAQFFPEDLGFSAHLRGGADEQIISRRGGIGPRLDFEMQDLGLRRDERLNPIQFARVLGDFR